MLSCLILIMERSEPTLVPEWLRSSGSVSGSGNSAQQFASSSSQSDVSSQAHYLRSRTSKSISDIDKPHDFLDWSSSSSSKRSSSNGSGKNAYSSFNRNYRDRDRDREKEKEMSNHGDPWGHDFSVPLVNKFSSRTEKKTLRRSHSSVSSVSRKQGDLFPQRVAVDSKSGAYNHEVNSNGFHSGSTINRITDKAVFDKDFPSLGSEERQGGPDVRRVSSSGLTTSVQSLAIGNSTLIGREGWTSALAEVPTILTGSTAAPSSVQLTVAANSGLGSPNATTPRKMAEALTQAPTRAHVTPQLTETQRLEELAIKQSRQLIPVTPSMSKVSVLNSFEKSKSNRASRTAELNVPAKGSQQPFSHVLHNSQSIRGGQVKSDSPKICHGKFLVLKPVWENGVLKDGSNLISNVKSRTPNCQPSVVASSATPNSSRNQDNLNPPSSLERKVAALDLKSGSTLEKRPPSSQSQSRNDFFNLIKKKTSVNGSTGLQDSGNCTSPVKKKSGMVNGEARSAAVHPTVTDEVTSNGNITEEVQRLSEGMNKSLSPSIALCTAEEEAAFLRSLGWDENSGNDEEITEKEINDFYEQYFNLKPSLKPIICKSPEPSNAV